MGVFLWKQKRVQMKHKYMNTQKKLQKDLSQQQCSDCKQFG